MKIMVVTPYYAPRIGGLENYARNVVLGLVARGHEVMVVTSGERGFRTTTDTVDGVRVVRLPVWLTASNTPVNPLWAFQLRAQIRRERPDVVLAHTPVPFIADLAARAAGSVPLVITYHNDLAKDSPLLRAIVAVYWWVLGHGTLERADRLIATSRFYADSSPFLQRYRAKTEVIRPGVDLERFHPGVDPSPVRSRFPDRQLVLFVSSLARSHSHKGLPLLLDAMAALRADHPNLHLIVVGKGDALPDYEERVRALGLDGEVTFTGFVPDDELPTYYAAADVFVLPSTNTAEGFGMVLLEAAACGTAVIGTNVGGIPAALAAAGSPHLAEPSVASLAGVLHSVLTQTPGARDPGERDRATPVALPAPSGSWQEAAASTEVVLSAARRPRVTLIHNVVSPYRLALFDELSREVNLRVLFTQGAGQGRLWSVELDQHSFDGRLLPSRSAGPIAYNPAGWRRLRRSRFDLLITNTDPDTAPLSLSGLLLARLRNRSIVVWSEVTDDVVRSLPVLVGSVDPFKAGLAEALRWAVLRYRKLFFKRATANLAFSQAASSFLRRCGVNQDAVVRTYEVVPQHLLPPALEEHARDGRTFLVVAYLTQRKNVSLLLEAFKALSQPDARLFIAGSGPEEGRLRELAQGDPRVTFVGHVDKQEKAELYASCDVLVLPTLHDCWGLVVNEAIYYGLAVIVSDAAAASEIVDPARGIVVPSRDARALTAAMTRLIEDPATLRAMQEHNRGSASVHDVSRAVQGMAQAIAVSLP